MNSTDQIAMTLKQLETEGVSPSHGTESLYIIYVDDESDLLESVSETVVEFGFKSHCTTSIEAALTFIEQHQHEIAYILSDYKMGTMSGFSFREKVLTLAPEIPFVILSANITKELALKGLDLKISGFVDKPINAEKFSGIMLRDGVSRIKALKEDRELLLGFVDEATTNLEQAEDLALAFERNPGDLEAVNKCFGLVHTLKGASGYFKPKTLHHFVHRFEDLLKKLQRGETALSPDVVSTILKSFDLVKCLLEEFRTREHKVYDLEAIFREYFELTNESTGSNGETHSKKIDDSASNSKSQLAKDTHKDKPNDLKVPVKLLDSFMQTSGEMTVIRNMINKCVKSIETQLPLNKDVSMLSELLEELHEINASVQSQITNLRKVPIHNILKPIHRAARDVSKALGKEIEIVAIGEDLAVDTAIAGVLSNSIIHLVRNSLDHGIELPSDRAAAGKPKKGNVTITSIQKNDVIYVSIKDDGRGISEDSVRKKLVKNGTHTAEQAARLENQALYLMIFEPGFSTAEKVTDISGRGVGMSMVKDSVSSVGGQIDIESTAGQGSQFTLRLPVPKSVLIRDCLFVASQGMFFGIPQEDVLRVITMPTGDSQNSLFRTEGGAAINYEDELISIADLTTLLKTRPDSISKPLTHDEMLKLVVIGSGRSKMALRVDSILDIEDTVIKPLNGPVKKIEVYQGAAFMGDGTIGLILSTEGLLKIAGIGTKAAHHKKSATSSSKTDSGPNCPGDLSMSSDLLLFRAGDPTLYAIPTHAIYRIEEIDFSQVRTSGGNRVTPYRGKVLTLIDLSEKLGAIDANQKPATVAPLKLKTFVIESKNHFIGLTVEVIDDIARPLENLILPISHQFGIAGNYLIDQRTVTLINLDEIIESIAGAEENHAPSERKENQKAA